MKTLKSPIIILLCIMVLLTSCTTTPSEATGTCPVFREDASPTEQYLRLFNDFNSYLDFTPSQAGTYTVYVYAFDDSGFLLGKWNTRISVQ